MSDRIKQLTDEIMKKVGLHTFYTKKEIRTYISACMRTVQGEAERAERERIMGKAKVICDDLYNRLSDA